MTGDTWLALAEDLGQLADGQFGFAQDQQQPEPSGVTDRAEHGKKLIHGWHINISLYAYAMAKDGWSQTTKRMASSPGFRGFDTSVQAART